jgi:hypothetical protein
VAGWPPPRGRARATFNGSPAGSPSNLAALLPLRASWAAQDRLKAYAKKVRKAVAEKELSESRRSLEVNVAALSRVITHAVPDLSTQQKQALNAQGKVRGWADP